MNTSDGHQTPGLWFLPGDAVLARLGSRVLLSSADGNGFLEKLLDGLAETAADGPDFARLAEDAIVSDGGRRGGQQVPAVVAVGPSAAGTAITVSGTAWAEVTTTAGVRQIEAGPSALLVRCVLAADLIAVHGGIGGERGRARIDRFSRLDAGTVRAGGFSYHHGPPSTQPGPPGVKATASAPPPPASPQPGAAEAVTGTHNGTGDGQAPQPASAGAAPAGAGEPFEAVLLVGDRPEDAGERPALPLEAAPPGSEAAADAPIITGVYCKNGHFDDPAARFCAVCGISMNQLTLIPRPGRRPPLGVLVRDDGAVFQLDHDYVIGRDPTMDALVALGKARPLHTTDGDGAVSRVHARIQLDGWLVQITDLGSTNGTRVRLPGEAADHLLTPRVPTALQPGSRIDIGGRHLRYESHGGQ
jgi:FHA domain-containing protein